MKPEIVVNQRPHQGFDKVIFPANMRERHQSDITNGSPMTKSVKFSIFLKKLECNSVCFNVHTFLLVLGGLFTALLQLLGGSS